MATVEVNTLTQSNKSTQDVWFGFTDLVTERPLGKNNAKLIPSSLKKEDGSRERKKKRKSRSEGLQCCTPETNGLFLHFAEEKKPGQ